MPDTNGLRRRKQIRSVTDQLSSQQLISVLPVQQSGDSGGISCGLSNKKSAETSLPILWTAKSFCVLDCVNAHELFRDDAFAGHNLTPIRQFQARSFPEAKEILHREAPREEGSKQILLSHLPNFYLSNILNMNHKTHEIKLLETAAGH